MITINHIQNKIINEIEFCLNDFAFKKNQDDSFTKEDSTGIEKIVFDFFIYFGKMGVTYTCYKRIDDVESLWDDIKADLFEDDHEEFTVKFQRIKLYPELILRGKNYPERRGFYMFNIDELDEEIKNFCRLFYSEFKEKIEPFFKTINLLWLDREINTSILTLNRNKFICDSAGYYYKKLIVAKLVNNKNYNELCSIVLVMLKNLTATNGKNNNYIKGFFEVIERLDRL